MKCQKPRFFVRRSGAFDLVAIRDFGSEKRKKEKGEQRTLVGARPLHLLSQTVWSLESPTGAFVADANVNITLLHRAGVVPVRLHRSGTAVRIWELYSTSCRAAKSSSPVRILTTRVTL